MEGELIKTRMRKINSSLYVLVPAPFSRVLENKEAYFDIKTMSIIFLDKKEEEKEEEDRKEN